MSVNLYDSGTGKLKRIAGLADGSEIKESVAGLQTGLSEAQKDLDDMRRDVDGIMDVVPEGIEEGDVLALKSSVDGIQNLIPDAASSTNKLVAANGAVDRLYPRSPWVSDDFDKAKIDTIGVAVFTVLNSATNTPATGANYVVVYVGFSETLGRQVAIQNNNNSVYVRYRSGADTWGDWERLASRSEVNAINALIPSGASSSNQLATANDFTRANTMSKYAGLNTGSGTEINLDDYTESGKRWNVTRANYTTLTNFPTQGHSHYVVWNVNADNSDNYIIQFCWPISTTEIYCRRKSVNWTAWTRLVTQADLTSAVTSGSAAPITSGGVYTVLNTVSATTVTLSPTDSAADNVTLRLRKNGKIVTASYFNSRTDSGTLKTNWTSIGTIPTGYRPAETVYATVNHANSHNVTVGLQFNSNGSIAQYNYTNGNLGYERSVNLVWITA